MSQQAVSADIIPNSANIFPKNGRNKVQYKQLEGTDKLVTMQI